MFQRENSAANVKAKRTGSRIESTSEVRLIGEPWRRPKESQPAKKERLCRTVLICGYSMNRHPFP